MQLSFARAHNDYFFNERYRPRRRVPVSEKRLIKIRECSSSRRAQRRYRRPRAFIVTEKKRRVVFAPPLRLFAFLIARLINSLNGYFYCALLYGDAPGFSRFSRIWPVGINSSGARNACTFETMLAVDEAAACHSESAAIEIFAICRRICAQKPNARTLYASDGALPQGQRNFNRCVFVLATHEEFDIVS